MSYSKHLGLIVAFGLSYLGVMNQAVLAQTRVQLNSPKAYSSPFQPIPNQRKAAKATDLRGTQAVNLRTTQSSETAPSQRQRVARGSGSILDFVQLSPAIGPLDVPTTNEDRGLKIQVKGRED